MPDPRAIALARYLRATAQEFSEVAESMDLLSVAEAGLVLLDVADIVQDWDPASPQLRSLAQAGLFLTGDDGRTRFRATDPIRHELRRGLFGELQAPALVLDCLVDLASRGGQPHPEPPA